MIDTTEARRAAGALRAVQEHLKQVFDSAPVVLFALDEHGVVTLSEGSGLRTLGLAPGEAVGRNAFDLYRDEPELLASMRRALAGEAFTSVARVRGLDRWWETRWTPLFDADGHPAGVSGVSIDVSDRKRAEEASAMAMSLLRATLEAINEGVLVVDSGGRIVDYNHAFSEMWGIPEETLEARVERARSPSPSRSCATPTPSSARCARSTPIPTPSAATSSSCTTVASSSAPRARSASAAPASAASGASATSPPSGAPPVAPPSSLPPPRCWPARSRT
jgi:PAS domain S-box-containing protein